METKDQETIIYPYLPEGRTILFVPKNNKYILAAKEVAEKESTEKNHPTGAVIVNTDGSILCKASNQSSFKSPFMIQTHKKWCIRRFFKIPSGKKYWLCPGCASHKYHSEYQVAVELKKKFPQKISMGLDLYLWGHWWCCKPCWDKMIEAGIRNVYVMENASNLFK